MNHNSAKPELLIAALRYAVKDFQVFPLHDVVRGSCSCSGKPCQKSPGKHPRTKNGFLDATADPAIIQGWWTKWPTANIGIRTGSEGGFWMLGPDGEQGIADLKALVAIHGPLPRTRKLNSGSGGNHYYFRYPSDGLKIPLRKNHNGTKIDVRGDGGYVVAPPSVNENGLYVWLDECDLADAPPWLLLWVRTNPSKPQDDNPPPRAGSGGSQAVVERARKYLAKIAGAVSGQAGHDQTFAAARAMVYGFDLGEGVALDLLLNEYNSRCLPPWSEKELRHKITDANTRPFDKTRGWLRDEQRPGFQGEADDVDLSNIKSKWTTNEHSEQSNGEPPPAPEPTPASGATEVPEERQWPEPLAAEAFIGPIGEFVMAVEPETEADPAAVLLQALLMFGNVVGRSAFVQVGADRHYANENLVVVGETSGGRKGTSAGVASELFRGVDDAWTQSRNAKGLSSGEGLIWFVRDPIPESVNVAKRGEPPRYEMVEKDPGEPDKRSMILEPEFVNVLKQAERQGNTLSSIIRQAWESGTLRTLTKNSPAKASNAHITINGHITEAELKKYLSEVETANGFANRFLWMVSKRSKYLPDAPILSGKGITGPRQAIIDAVQFASNLERVERDDGANAIWRVVYEKLETDRGGLCGAMLARAASHVNRLSLIYALSERSPVIEPRHLLAALAVWEYVERSVAYLFGDSTGDGVADEALRLIRGCPGGIARSAIRDFFARNLSSDRLTQALSLLLKLKRVRREEVETGGRPAEMWFPARGAK